MGLVADELEALTVRVSSPDGNIQGELKGRAVRFAFRPGTYRNYREADLEHQFARLMTLLSTGYRRGHGQVMSRHGFTSIVKPSDTEDAGTRQYLDGMVNMRLSGATSKRLLRLRCTGMRDWRCRIAEGALGKLSQSELVAEAEAAVLALIDDYLEQRLFLKDEVFGLGVPEIRDARLAARG